MFDHIGIVVKDIEKSRAFYTACLAPLGVQLLQDNTTSSSEGWLVYGTSPDAPFFVVAAGTPSFWQSEHEAGRTPMHLAFSAPTDVAVNEFYQQGLENNGTDNGAPGPRQSSGEYYAAYLIDLDGNNFEAGFRKL